MSHHVPNDPDLSRGGQRPLEVLFEDNHLLVLNKPVGLATMGGVAGRTSLVDLAKDYLREKYQKPGNVYLGVVSRLDLPVSGVIVFARTSKAAARLNRQFLERTVEKRYWLWIPSGQLPATGTWQDWIGPDERLGRMQVRATPFPGGRPAELSYVRMEQRGSVSLVEAYPRTGRKHQIRAQFAARGCPIVGDRRYGSQVRFPSGIGLHARSLRICHPTRAESMLFVAAPPPAWHT